MKRQYRFHPKHREVKVKDGGVGGSATRILGPMRKGEVPLLLPKHFAAQKALFDLDAAETPNEWNWALATLVMHLLRAVSPEFGGAMEPEPQEDAIFQIGGRIGAGFQPPIGRPSPVITARDDAMWLSALAPDTTFSEAASYLAELRGITTYQAKLRVKRVEREVARKYVREKPFGHGRR